jgi:hypothetical protein
MAPVKNLVRTDHPCLRVGCHSQRCGRGPAAARRGGGAPRLWVGPEGGTAEEGDDGVAREIWQVTRSPYLSTRSKLLFSSCPLNRKHSLNSFFLSDF